MIRLRQATLADVGAIARIHIVARREAMPYLPELHREDETLAWVQGVLLPAQDVWVAELDGLVCGYIAVERSMIEALYVRPECQGRGIGSALLDHAMDRSGGMLELWTFQRNTRARAFYEARGFVAMEFTDGSGNEEREPDVRYGWRRQA